MRISSREQATSKELQEKAVVLRSNRVKKSIDYTKLENPLYVAQHHELRQTAGEENVDHFQTIVNHNKPIRDDSLVKHMTNLPGYLQRVEKSENVQGKALNFGVLDWGRLENWKSNEKRIPPRYNLKSPHSKSNPTLVKSGSAMFSRNKKKVHSPRKDQQASNCSPLNSSSGPRLPPGVRWPRGKPVKSQISESPPCMNELPSGDINKIVETDSSTGKQVDQVTSDLIKQGSCLPPHHLKMPSADNISQTSDPCPSNDHLVEENESTLSSCFLPGEFETLNPISDVPHSCPFPLSLGAEVQSPDDMLVTPLRLKEKSKAVKKLDLDMDEQPALKGRHASSPNGRFNFSLGKMARSFSFKETSSAPQQSPTYVSVKSGPVNFAASPDLVNHNWKKGNATTPSRSSPLRRLLSPLLKLKGAHLAEMDNTSKLELSPSNVVTSVNQNESFYSRKHISPNVQALLQLTLKNGIPFFKLVVESSSDILAAAVKRLPSGKDDTSLTYAFYSVHETKKKSGGWIYQSSKEKNFQFGYKIVGEMKISSSYHAEFSGPEKDLYVVRESVLCSIDTMKADQKTVDGTLAGELAAIIVKNPSDKTCGGIGSSNSTVVILPDGVHSWPNGGVPSPLINRWRSGGACDCGGWDIGCQFHILSHQHEIIKDSSPSTLNITSNCLELCYQVGHKNTCNFRLLLLEDGLYSVDYDPSMSLLQAFSICVAVVSSQKLTHIFQVNYVPESKELSQPILTGGEKLKSQEGYFSKPPTSPVGRV
uniref:uncharacterized protein LOC122592618 n=1 Tax=Erigeron canadensis TaxID=72917 RepID=UPI001CB97E0C|nr:uncharacterized protein LOC122592618 [Erigeron canadensis]